MQFWAYLSFTPRVIAYFFCQIWVIGDQEVVKDGTGLNLILKKKKNQKQCVFYYQVLHENKFKKKKKLYFHRISTSLHIELKRNNLPWLEKKDSCGQTRNKLKHKTLQWYQQQQDIGMCTSKTLLFLARL